MFLRNKDDLKENHSKECNKGDIYLVNYWVMTSADWQQNQFYIQAILLANCYEENVGCMPRIQEPPEKHSIPRRSNPNKGVKRWK